MRDHVICSNSGQDFDDRPFLFQLPQFSSGLRIFPANEAIDHVGLDLAWSHWVNANALLGEFEGHHLDLSPPLRASTRYRYESMRHCFGRRFEGREGLTAQPI